MDDELLRQYALTIANTVSVMTRGFGPRLDQWDFMLVSQPKIPFANETAVPNITYTYNFETNEKASAVVQMLHEFLYGTPYEPKGSDNGCYLICFVKE